MDRNERIPDYLSGTVTEKIFATRPVERAQPSRPVDWRRNTPLYTSGIESQKRESALSEREFITAVEARDLLGGHTFYKAIKEGTLALLPNGARKRGKLVSGATVRQLLQEE